MQLGTRWSSGAEPPASVPDVLRPGIASVEAAGHRGSWTLTWLEGRPIAESDAGWEVLVAPNGEVVAREFAD